MPESGVHPKLIDGSFEKLAEYGVSSFTFVANSVDHAGTRGDLQAGNQTPGPCDKPYFLYYNHHPVKSKVSTVVEDKRLWEA